MDPYARFQPLFILPSGSPSGAMLRAQVMCSAYLDADKWVQARSSVGAG
jgi:hypothetical protein